MSKGKAAPESLVCISSARVDACGVTVGFSPCSADELSALAPSAAITFHERAKAETDERFRQLVAYVVVFVEDGVFVYRRSRHSSEPRLRNRWSVGIGGHVEARDLIAARDEINISETVNAACHRELSEELDIAYARSPHCLGLIRDDSNAVARVHLGVVYGVLAGSEPQARESNLVDGRIDVISEVGRRTGELETWSELLVPHLARLFVRMREG